MKMFIESAIAAEVAVPGTANPAMPEAPSTGSLMMQNMVMVAILVVLFYLLLIKPQQKRFQEHSQMLSGLKKGDRVVTGGGLIGIIDKLEGNDEVIVDLGNGLKVTALRSSIQGKDDPAKRQRVANDQKEKASNPQ